MTVCPIRTPRSIRRIANNHENTKAWKFFNTFTVSSCFRDKKPNTRKRRPLRAPQHSPHRQGRRLCSFNQVRLRNISFFDTGDIFPNPQFWFHRAFKKLRNQFLDRRESSAGQYICRHSAYGPDKRRDPGSTTVALISIASAALAMTKGMHALSGSSPAQVPMYNVFFFFFRTCFFSSHFQFNVLKSVKQ